MLERSQAPDPLQLGNVAQELAILTTQTRTVTIPTKTDGSAPRAIYVSISNAGLVVRPYHSNQAAPATAQCIPTTSYSSIILYCGGMNRLHVANNTTTTVAVLTVTALDNQ